MRPQRSLRTVRVGSRYVRLTPIEFALVSALARKPGQTFSRTELVAKVWGREGRVSIRTVDAHIMKIRKKLKHLPEFARYLKTVHCIGYKLQSQAISALTLKKVKPVNT
jgi:DNA-binding response OmpR family regulator